MSLDPFQPEKAADVAHLKTIQRDVHAMFIALVEERRGDKLGPEGREDLFSGLFWSGAEALKLGLIDGLSDIRATMREKLGPDVRLKLVSPQRSLFRRASRGVFAEALDRGPLPSLADDVISAIEARGLWSRYGL